MRNKTEKRRQLKEFSALLGSCSKSFQYLYFCYDTFYRSIHVLLWTIVSCHFRVTQADSKTYQYIFFWQLIRWLGPAYNRKHTVTSTEIRFRRENCEVKYIMQLQFSYSQNMTVVTKPLRSLPVSASWSPCCRVWVMGSKNWGVSCLSLPPY